MGDRKQPTPPPKSPLFPTKNAYISAFEMWENEFRADPRAFLTASEMAAMGVLPLSEQRATCFEGILSRVAGAGNQLRKADT